MKQCLTTNNLLEVAFLLECDHVMVNVESNPSWPYAIHELVVTMEGEDIFQDRGQFFLEGVADVTRVFFACRTIEKCLWQKYQDTQGIYGEAARFDDDLATPDQSASSQGDAQ